MTDKLDNCGYDEDDILTLEFDDGVEEECGIIGVFDVDDEEYIALNPLGTEDVYIYYYKEDGDDYDLFDIESDADFAKAAEELERLTVEEA